MDKAAVEQHLVQWLTSCAAMHWKAWGTCGAS
jgi:hypothetical protein